MVLDPRTGQAVASATAICAVRHVLPSAFLVCLLRRVELMRRPGVSAHPTFARFLLLSALRTAVAAFLLLRPVRTCCRLLFVHGRLAPDAPGRLPIIGHMLAMSKLPVLKPGIWDYFVDLHSKLGRTFRMVVGPECAPLKVFMFTSDPVNVEHILKNKFENYGKGQEVEAVFEEFLGKGIFAVDGDRWKQQRKVAAGIFSRKNFSENMVHVFQAHARRLVTVLQRQVAEAQQRCGCTEVDLQALFFSLTLDAFCEIGFGLPWNSMATEAVGAATGHHQHHWAHHFDVAQAAMVTRFAYRPWWRIERMLAKCGLMPATHDESRLIESVNYMNGVVRELLDQRFQQADGKRGSDLLSLFIEVTTDRTYLRDIVMNLVIAGRDTTACTLSWLFWELSQHPDARAKARREILLETGYDALATRDGDLSGKIDVSFDVLSRLKFCTACVRETVRLHPPVPSDPKVAFADDTLPDGSLVSRGDYVFYGAYQMGRDPTLWGKDATEWKPVRWLTIEKEPSHFVNCAFQAGPRICLGREMAILEAKAVLVEVLLAGLSWEVRPGFVPEYKYPSIVLPMDSPGLPVRISHL